MLRVRTADLVPGMFLARPVPMPRDPCRYLLQRDIELTASLIRRLGELEVQEVWVRCDELSFLEDLIDEDLHERQRTLYASIRQNFEKVMRLADAQIDFVSLKNTVSDLFEYLKTNPAGLVFLDKVQLFDSYLMCHSANVSYMCMLLGLKLDWYMIQERRHANGAEDARDVAALGLGGLLHDVGKLQLPRAVLDKPGRLTAEEMDLIRLHPLLGYEMVRGRVPAASAQVVLNHHQRWDGTGYPRLKHPSTGEELPPLAGKRINIFARIAVIADVFDAATTKRVYSDAKPSVQALFEMLRYNRGFFDPVVEQAFFEVVPAFPIGMQVQLSNQWVAAVVEFDPQHPCRPKVRPIRYPDGQPCVFPDTMEIDLAETDDLEIHSVNGIEVRPYLFDAPFAEQALPARSAR